MQNIYN